MNAQINEQINDIYSLRLWMGNSIIILNTFPSNEVIAML